MSRTDIKDWYAMLHVGGSLTAGTYFVFLHPEHFATYCGFVGTVGAIFHWICVRDDKVPDAIPSASKTDSQ